MRVYLPLTLPRLAALHRTGDVGPAPLPVYAVTPPLRERYPDEGGEEELEYVALGRAAAASLRLLADDPEAPRRRVVLAADVAPEQVESGTGPALDPEALGELWLSHPLPRRLAAAVHLDDVAAEDDVAAAVTALTAADQGDEAARHAVAAAEDHDLLWYGVQEIDTLV